MNKNRIVSDEPKDSDKTELRALLEKAAAKFGVDLDIRNAKRSGSLGYYTFGKLLFRAKSYVEMDELHKAAMVLAELVPYLFEHIGRISPSKLGSPETAADLRETSDLAIELSQVCAKWKKESKDVAVEELRKTGLFTEKELDTEIEMFTDVQIDTVFDDDYVRVYRLKDGAAPLPTSLQFKMVKEVSVSRDLDGYVRSAHYLSAKAPGTIVFVPFFKVEERVDLSFWTFFIVYEDHVWIATDQKEFHNPRNKRTTRRTDRVRDKKLENMWLPDVFAMLETKRSKSREIEAFGGIKKLLGIKLSEFHPASRFFLIKLAEKIVRKCVREELVQATTMGLHSEQLLIEHNGAVPDKTDKLEGWHDDAQTHYKELMAVVPQTVTKALVPMDYSIVVRSKDFDRNWLGTPEQLDSIAHWMVVDSRRAEIQKHFTSLEKRKDQDSKALQKMLNDRSAEILKLAFSALQVGWISTAVEDFGSDVMRSGSKFVCRFVEPTPEKKRQGRWYPGFDHFAIGLATPMTDLFSKEKDYKSKCRSCDTSVRTPAKSIHIRHWKQLQFLLGGSRDLIPAYYRCYKAHNFIPYSGNSILDNTSPLTLIDDHCSEKNPNGIDLHLFICKRCANRMEEGKPAKLVFDGAGLVDPKTLSGVKKSEYYGWVVYKACSQTGRGST